VIVSVKVKLVTPDSKKNDKYLGDGLTTVVKMHFVHSHPVDNAQLLSLRPMAQSTINHLHMCFNDGLGPAAVRTVLCDQAEMDPNRSVLVSDRWLADAAIYPKPRAIYYQHDQWLKQHLGGRGVESCYDTVTGKIPVYREASNTVLISKEPFAIAVVTPIMKRAHFLESAAGICFVDSTCTPRAVKKIFRPNLQEKCVSAPPQDTKCTPSQSKSQFLGVFAGW